MLLEQWEDELRAHDLESGSLNKRTKLPGPVVSRPHEPAADFHRLEQVLVVTQRIPQPPPGEPKG